MRISDWSSDVCSSDLIELAPQRIGDDPARFLDEDHAGRDIPGADALFPIGIETAAGDIGHIDRARAEPPDAADARGQPCHLRHELLVARLACKRDADREHGLNHRRARRSEEHTSELQSLMRTSY